LADAIYDELTGAGEPTTIVDALDPSRRRVLGAELAHEDLLVPVVRGGRSVSAHPSLVSIRDRVKAQLSSLDPTIRRLVKPHAYPVGLTRELYEQRTQLIARARGE
jgi:nicotinate phosphoribosyltransferase